jgi:tetratricopeptide (TPR) repeat protein
MITVSLFFTLLSFSEDSFCIDKINYLVGADKVLDALTVAQECLSKTPESVTLQKALAATYRNADSLDQAIQLYEQILAEHPDDSEARLGLAITLSWAGRLDESLETYKSIYDSDPKNIDALLGISQVYAWQGKLGPSIECCERALILKPVHYVIYQRLGQAHLWKGDMTKSIKNYRYFALLLKNLGVPWPAEDAEITYIGLAKTYEWSGFPITALEYYKKALKVNPSSREGREGLERLARAGRPNLFVGGGGALENSSGVRGHYSDYSLGISKDMNDYVNSSLSFKSMGNRIGVIAKDYNLIGFKLRSRSFRWFQTTAHADFDVLAGSFKNFGISGGLSGSVLKLTGAVSQTQLEPTKDINVQSAAASLVLQPFRRLWVDGSIEQGEVLEDGNIRTIYRASGSCMLLKNPSLVVSFSHTFDSYARWSGDYYSPHDLRTNAIRASLFKGFGCFYSYSQCSGALSTNRVQTLDSSSEIGINIGNRSTISLQGQYFHTFQGYSLFSLHSALTYSL